MRSTMRSIDHDVYPDRKFLSRSTEQEALTATTTDGVCSTSWLKM